MINPILSLIKQTIIVQCEYHTMNVQYNCNINIVTLETNSLDNVMSSSDVVTMPLSDRRCSGTVL